MTVILGPSGCGKTERLVGAYRKLLAEGPLASTLWLSPNHRGAAAISQRLLASSLKGCFSPNCLTFDQLASRVLEASRLKARPISLLHQRQILARLIGSARAGGQLRYFAPIADKPGFLDLVVGFIQELKRLEIWPEELAAASGRASTEKDRELCRLYDDYQRLLTDHDLYDAQGRFWSARELMREGWPQLLARFRHVFVDGFTDFTRTEHEMLELLARQVDSVVISLPGEAESARADLFAKCAQTLSELRRRHPQLAVETMPRRATSWPAMAHVEANLFANPQHVAPAREVTGIEIVAAGGTTHEIELLAGRIKRLLTQGDEDAGGQAVRPTDILVVFRSLDGAADQVRETFAEFGIPLAIGTRPALGRAPIISGLRAWLRLALDDWPFRQLLAILMHNYFRPQWQEWQQGRAAAAAEQIVHRLQIPSGRAALIASVRRMAQRAGDSESIDVQTDDDGRASTAVQARLAAPLLERMATALDALPTEGTIAHWTTALARLADSVGLLAATDPGSPARSADATADGATSDGRAWEQLLAVLVDSERLAQQIDGHPAVFSLRELIDQLDEIALCEALEGDHDETGRVRVLSAEHARTLAAPYVFVAGLAEKAFPAPGREDCLYSAAETAQLVAAGLPLVSHAERSRYEMLLFYEVITRATRRLILSYPALDPRGQPLSPSPYVNEIESICRPLAVRKTAGPELSSVPPTDDVLSPREFRVRAVSQAVGGNWGLLGELHAHPAMRKASDNLLAGLRTSYARMRGESFGPYEGILTSDAAVRALQSRYGPERCWSPSQLEQYARCPHQFFLERVLRLKPLDGPTLEIDYLGRGQMLHWLLSALHRNLNDRLGGPGSPADQAEEEFLAEIRTLLTGLLERTQGNGETSSGLLELDSRHVAAALAGYRRQHADYDDRWGGWESPLRPAHFEVAFGPSRHGGDSSDAVDQDALSTEKPFELACGDETFRFSGRIDRIDVGTVGGQVVFNIVDYKSGRASARTSGTSVMQGYSLQLPLYALAAQELLGQRGALPFRAAYWHVAGDGYKEVVKFHAEGDGELSIHPEWGELDTQLRFRVRSLVAGIRSGQFPMHSSDDKCTSHCAYSTVCRVNQVRSLEKTWQPPGETAP